MGIVTRIQVYILPVKESYNLLLGLLWANIVNLNIGYRSYKVIIKGSNNKVVQLLSRYIPDDIKKVLPRSIDKEDKDNNNSDIEDILEKLV